MLFAPELSFYVISVVCSEVFISLFYPQLSLSALTVVCHPFLIMLTKLYGPQIWSFHTKFVCPIALILLTVCLPSFRLLVVFALQLVSMTCQRQCARLLDLRVLSLPSVRFYPIELSCHCPFPLVSVAFYDCLCEYRCLKSETNHVSLETAHCSIIHSLIRFVVAVVFCLFVFR